MDNSSQPDPAAQPAPPATPPNDYPKYPTLNTAPPAQPKKRPKLLFFAAGLLLVLVLVSAVVFIQGGGKNKSVACTSEQCFSQRFAPCLPAAYTVNNQGGSIRYTIIGSHGVGCAVNMKYLKANYSADMTGKTMTCDLDNRKGFQTATQNAFLFPDDYACSGELASIFKDVNNTDNQP